MARIRKFVSYRRLERPYTRISKYRELSYVRARPHNKIVKFDVGNLNTDFQFSIRLKANDNLQIRDNAIEAARQSSNRYLVTKTGKMGFHLKIRTYPHHILRENPLASGAGADRMSTGMKNSFGKSIGIAAQIKKGQVIMQADVKKEHVQFAKDAMKRAAHKFPCSCSVEVVENKVAQ